MSAAPQILRNWEDDPNYQDIMKGYSERNDTDMDTVKGMVREMLQQREDAQKNIEQSITSDEWRRARYQMEKLGDRWFPLWNRTHI